MGNFGDDVHWHHFYSLCITDMCQVGRTIENTRRVCIFIQCVFVPQDIDKAVETAAELGNDGEGFVLAEELVAVIKYLVSLDGAVSRDKTATVEDAVNSNALERKKKLFGLVCCMMSFFRFLGQTGAFQLTMC